MSTPPGEFDLIAKYFAPLAAGEAGAFQLGDDAAAISPNDGQTFVLTADTLSEGIHFLPNDPPETISRKALRVNLSDLAAMGATPRAYTLALALGPGLEEKWLSDFVSGLSADQERFGITLIGGDTTAAASGTTISITAIGEAAPAQILRRDGARVGDDIWVSGTIGDAALGLSILSGDGEIPDQHHGIGVEAYRLPEPRVSLGARLRTIATSAIDVSDGLVADLGHVCHQSGKGAIVELPHVPLSELGQAVVEKNDEWLQRLVIGGDDYELLFTAPPVSAREISAISDDLGLELTNIGRIEAGVGVEVLDINGEIVDLPSTGYQHF